MPQLRQANCSENSRVSPSCSPLTISTSISPAARPAAASTDSESRRRSYKVRFEGIVNNLQRRYEETDSESNRERIEGYMAE
ncbi:MAG TPA: hypothetical protein VGV34_01730, partial [Solirubrobacterales bacterium]|nr:hypothetical protein [Solirubrobacterales bacterium]